MRFFAEQVVPSRGARWISSARSAISPISSPPGAICTRRRRCFETPSTRRRSASPISDRGGGFLRFNDAFCALLGYASSDLAGKSVGELTHDEDAAVAAAQLERLWAAEIQFVDLEKRYLRKDGSYLWVRTTTALVRDGSNTECSVEYVRDITQRKELAAALLQQQTLLEAVITDLPVALLVCDVAGNITHYNRAAVDLYCIQPHDPASAEPSDPYPLRGRCVSVRRPHPCSAGGAPVGPRAARRDHQQPGARHRAARLAAAAHHLVERAPAGRAERRNTGRGGGHPGYDRAQAPGTGARARTQGADDGVAPGRHGRGRHQCSAQRRQHIEQREYFGEPRGRAGAAIQGPRRLAPRRAAARAGRGEPDNSSATTSAASAYRSILPRSANS